MAVLPRSGAIHLQITWSNQSLVPVVSNLHGAPETSLDMDISRPLSQPHQPNGGLAILTGNLGRAVIKISAVDPTYHRITARAAVFDNEADVKTAFNEGRLTGDVAVVVRFQGPQANGMPELHSLIPILSSLQQAGHAVMLITDGRMSGASGQVPAALHVTPVAINGGAIGAIRDGDIITLDVATGRLNVEADLSQRPQVRSNLFEGGFGRELFSNMREQAASAEAGGGINSMEISMSVLSIMSIGPVIPVVIIENIDDAIPLADALTEGGIGTIEITLRSVAALDAIALISKERPEHDCWGWNGPKSASDAKSSGDRC